MKRLTTLIFCAALSFGVWAQTKVPLSTLNPAGSAAGQAILSTGPTTAPQWGAVANTSQPLSQFAATTSAQLAGVLTNETGTGVAVFGTSPTLTKPNIVGTVANDNAAAGSVGEYLTAAGSAVSISNTTATNCTSRALTAGDYDVWGSITFTPGATTTVTIVQAGLNTTSATIPSAGNLWTLQGSLTTGATQSAAVPYQRVKLTSSGTVYLVGFAAFGVSTMTMTCNIHVRRAW